MRIFITGGLGSLGRRLGYYFSQQQDVERVILYGRNEYQLYVAETLLKELLPFGDFEKLAFFQGDIRDRRRLDLSLSSNSIDVVIHAAALKRVDVALNNPVEIQRTNIQGTENVLEASLRHGVKKFIFVSSDKAVNPTNIYGASKYFGEEMVKHFNVYSQPKGMSCYSVRYGNVLGSRGSVYWLWRKAMLNDVEVYLTSTAMTRFLITFKHAVKTIQYAIYHGGAGETIVPNLPVYCLTNFLDAMSRTFNYKRDAVLVGRRLGGEKYHESLLAEGEVPYAHRHTAYGESFFVHHDSNALVEPQDQRARVCLSSDVSRLGSTVLSSDDLISALNDFINDRPSSILSSPDRLD